ncbi:MAG: ribose-5-phosphate isomerase RpiA [Pseudomonadota bacterium]
MDTYKKAAAVAALDYVEDGTTIGLGTGSTAAHFVRALGERVRGGLSVRGVPTSEATAQLAMDCGIELVETEEATQLALVVDGADEIDPHLDLIKGGGAALLREKIIADAAAKMVVIADASKAVSRLGAFPLPIEIDRFAFALTVRRVREVLAAHGLAAAPAALRSEKSGAVLSDGGHYILDARCGRIPDAGALDAALRAVPGVVETGLFVGLCDVALIAGEGGVERRERR